MQLFYASPALGVRDQSRANPLSFRILRAPFIRVSAHSALRHSTMRAHHLGLARETAAGNTQLIYIYIYTQLIYIRVPSLDARIRINFQEEGGGRNE